jgi:N-acetylmuramoyl-L-alanine amidase
MSFRPTHIVVHHSLTADSKAVSWGAIRDFHVNERAWADIGYHAGVELAGSEYEVLVGRPWDREGAHCKDGGMNHIALGVVLVGSFDMTAPPDAQLEVLTSRVLLPWMRMFGIPALNVTPHRFYAPDRSCPGRAFTGELMARFLPGIPKDRWR